MDDIGGDRQRAAVEAGAVLLKCGRAFEMVSKSELERTALNLQQQSPKVLWINLFNAHTPRGTRQDRLGLRAIVRLTNAQLAQERDVIIEAKRSNACLDMAEMQEIERDKRVARREIQWCALGICDDSGSRPADRQTLFITSLV